MCVRGLLILSSFTFILSILCPWGASGLRLPSKLSQIEFLLAGRYRPHPDRLERDGEGEREREKTITAHITRLKNFSLISLLAFLSYAPSPSLLLFPSSADFPAASLSSLTALFLCFSLFISLPVCLLLSLSAAIGVHQSFLLSVAFSFPLMIQSSPACSPSSIFYYPFSLDPRYPPSSLTIFFLPLCALFSPQFQSLLLLSHPSRHGWPRTRWHSTHQCALPAWRSLAPTIITH